MIKLDPHIHTLYSGDSKNIPDDIVKIAKKRGLDAIAITDHNTIKGYEVIAKRNIEDILIIPGIEISTREGHIVALGITEEIEKYLSAEETLERIRDLGGVAIAPHPFDKLRDSLGSTVKNLNFDAIEVLNGRCVSIGNLRAKKFAKKRNIPEIGASDAHFPEEIGACITIVDTHSGIDDILDAIQKGKTSAKANSSYHKRLYNVVNNLLKRG
ncbi:PHP domain protein [Methanothermus fervidus DSM 2088]|uniref:PHP domain protein n=1 Tax=Methanothermus fervidus (strain ATCC 43054 / DSM 2088 / JCM 10308 / V24 S) TaxID=523846 RepID=E3GW18_METFV|nr:PHP domain-containing protein [Methanothermus fervidus]ADP77783.1 PHP domain protein [Methanothermus fervidus DSM 2088]